MFCTYLKNINKPDVSEVVIQEAIRDVQDRRLFRKSSRFQIQNDPYSTALQNLKNQQVICHVYILICI